MILDSYPGFERFPNPDSIRLIKPEIAQFAAQMNARMPESRHPGCMAALARQLQDRVADLWSCSSPKQAQAVSIEIACIAMSVWQRVSE